MALVAGIDSSTQSCKIVVRDATTGELDRQASARHPDGTEVDPHHWWSAVEEVIEAIGGLADVAAVAVGGQQHGLVCLDDTGEVIRPALLWNDTRSAAAAEELITDLGDGDRDTGAAAWAEAVGVVPVASFTISKLRWLADHEPEHAERIAAICLPHDWLTWRLSGAASPDTLVTDRSDASGTGYFDPASNEYRRDLLALALRRDASAVADLRLPRVLGPRQPAGRGDPARDWSHLVLGPGCGDNAGAALGLGLRPGETSVSLGTSGVVASVAPEPVRDASGLVAGFADATGAHLPLACTLNGSRVLDAAAALLDVDHDELSRLALAAEPGAEGLSLIPYLEGERTPNLPDARGVMTGLSLASLSRANLARAAVEGLLGLMRNALDAVRAQGVPIDRVTLIGGGARSEAVRRIAPTILGTTVVVPTPGEYVADGAARQAAWVLAGTDLPPDWQPGDSTEHTGAEATEVVERYRTAAGAVPTLLGRAPGAPDHQTSGNAYTP